MFKRGLLAVIVIGALLLGFAQNAKAYVYETSHLATCSRFGLWGTTNAPYLRVDVYNAQTSASLYSSVVPSNGDGTLSVDVNFEAQPEGSILYYFVYGLRSASPTDYDGEYRYELNDGYPCAGGGTGGGPTPTPDPLYASTTSRTNKCSSFAATGTSNAPYIGVEVKTSAGTVLYRGKLSTYAGAFSFSVPFSQQKKGKVLSYRVWPSTTASVTEYDGSYGYYQSVACKK